MRLEKSDDDCQSTVPLIAPRLPKDWLTCKELDSLRRRLALAWRFKKAGRTVLLRVAFRKSCQRLNSLEALTSVNAPAPPAAWPLLLRLCVCDRKSEGI